jgi:glycine/D-amino acid oxidase-like deaminating enzyme
MTKVLIVGGGIAGLSAAWALSRGGCSVEIFEQGPLPNPRASSYDEHRILRHAYGDMEGYARLMPHAFATWEALWRDLGVRHYDPCGAVYFARNETPWYAASQRSLEAHGLGFRDIPIDEALRRFPMVRPEGLVRVVETDGAGMLFPIRILTDLVMKLAAMGVILHANAEVLEIEPDQPSALVGGTRHGADAIVIAAGAWADRLLPSLHAVARPSRQALLFLAPPPPLADAWAVAPILVDDRAERGCYTLPPRRGTRLKIGDDVFTLRGDVDADRTATAEDVERLTRVAALAYRDFESYAVLERKACYYTVTEDEKFIVRPVGAAAWVVSACSGHGFKFGPLMGEIAASAVMGKRSAEDTARLAAGDLALPLDAPSPPEGGLASR